MFRDKVYVYLFWALQHLFCLSHQACSYIPQRHTPGSVSIFQMRGSDTELPIHLAQI